MSWVPDRDDRDNDYDRKGGHVTPPERNPSPDRDQRPERQGDED